MVGIAVVVMVLAVLAGRWLWNNISGPSIQFPEESRILLIPTGSDLDAVVDSLISMGAIEDASTFRWLADQKKYSTKIRPGRYLVRQEMSLNDLVNMLRNGEQEPVNVTFTNIAHLPALAGRVSQYLEADSAKFLRAFEEPEIQRSVGLNSQTFISMFIPNTYQFWWTTTPEQFIARMRKEHETFWTEERKEMARAKGLSPVEASTLASIVQAETMRMPDAPRIAGVYLNRLRVGMPLQADPTLKFATGLYDAQRVLHTDKLVDSPYNTYKYTGLPPGPINMPEPRFVDAVLDAEKHDYFYFVAKADMSGFSEFSRNYEQHLVNARKYQRALNERQIYR